MSRKIQCITMALFLSVTMAASLQAAPTRTPLHKPTPEVGLFTEARRLFFTWLRGHPMSPPGQVSAPETTSQLDPNGQH
jgi:hypothetical protein